MACVNKIKIGEEIRDLQVNWANIPDHPDVVSKAEYDALKADYDKLQGLLNKTVKLAGLEDSMMFDLYPNYPVISFAADPGVEIVSINKGNKEIGATPFADEIKAGGRVVAYDKDGKGFINDGNGQFNAYVKPSQNMGVYLEPTYTGETTPYKNLDALAVKGQDYWQVKATKITRSFSVQIKECPAYNITVENYIDGATVTCPKKFASKATRCEFEISSSSATNPLTAATCNGIDLLSLNLIISKQKTNWTYSFDPNNENLAGDITLVFGTNPAGTPEVA